MNDLNERVEDLGNEVMCWHNDFPGIFNDGIQKIVSSVISSVVDGADIYFSFINNKVGFFVPPYAGEPHRKRPKLQIDVDDEGVTVWADLVCVIEREVDTALSYESQDDFETPEAIRAKLNMIATQIKEMAEGIK